MKVLIAGAGIGGLAAAIALRQTGHNVEVFERSSALREIGAGLMIWPNGTRALQALGVEVRALPVERISFRGWRGRRLIEIPIKTTFDRYGSDVAFVHRSDLQMALAAKLGHEGLHLGMEVAGFEDEGARVRVKFRHFGLASGDLLVGADGLGSAVRRQLLADGEAIYLGSTIWRGLLPSNGVALAPGHGVNWVGRGSEFLAFHLPDDRIYWAAVTKEPRGEKSGPDGHKGDLIQRFGGWQDPVSKMIAGTPESDIIRNDMYDRPPVRRWSRGRVTLLGDAAHPMTPNQGQGACQALEDAVVLGQSLAGRTDLGEAFEVYERLRLRRANRAVKLSRQATRGVQIDNPLLCAFRDTFASLLTPGMVRRMMRSTLGAASQSPG